MVHPGEEPRPGPNPDVDAVVLIGVIANIIAGYLLSSACPFGLMRGMRQRLLGEDLVSEDADQELLCYALERSSHQWPSGSHLWTVFRETFIWRATVAVGGPDSKRRTSCGRPPSMSRAVRCKQVSRVWCDLRTATRSLGGSTQTWIPTVSNVHGYDTSSVKGRADA